jgi:hypothetical protein
MIPTPLQCFPLSFDGKRLLAGASPRHGLIFLCADLEVILGCPPETIGPFAGWLCFDELISVSMSYGSAGENFRSWLTKVVTISPIRAWEKALDREGIHYRITPTMGPDETIVHLTEDLMFPSRFRGMIENAIREVLAHKKDNAISGT